MIVAVANQKGGSGKTTTAVNLGGALGELGYRILVADLDPQGNSTLHAGLMPDELERTIWSAMQQTSQPELQSEKKDFRALLDDLWITPSFDPELVPIIRQPNGNPFDLAPSNLEMSEADLILAAVVSRERRLATVLASIQQEYDYVLIDCPPHLGILTLNALTAAEAVIIPLKAAFFASAGMNQLFRILLQVRQGLNPRLAVLGVLITQVDRRTKHSQQIAAEAREALEGRVRVFQVEIPVNVDLADATAAGKCITLHAPRSSGAQAYRRLAKEIEGIRSEQEDRTDR